MKNKKKEPGIGSKAFGNRTVIGIICVVAAIAICFGVAPLVNKVSERTTKIVRITHTVPQGGMITEDALEVVEVGSFNLPKEVLRKKEDVVGQYAAVDLYAGEYLLPGKVNRLHYQDSKKEHRRRSSDVLCQGQSRRDYLTGRIQPGTGGTGQTKLQNTGIP